MIRFLLVASLVAGGAMLARCDNTEANVIAYRRCVAKLEKRVRSDPSWLSNFREHYHRTAQMAAEDHCQGNEVWDDMFDLDPNTPIGEINTTDWPTPHGGMPQRVRGSASQGRQNG